MVGVFLYLQPAVSWSRLVKLVVTLGISMTILGVGIYLIYPQQAWAANTTFPRWWESIYPFLLGISLSVNMTIPALLSYLPRGSNSSL
jgi:ribose/xylose/arabinose/galactoside ABC-type transport system permease subunit